MKKQLLLWLTKNVALSHSFKRLAFLAIALTLSFTASAIQYCQHTLTSGTSTIKVSYESPSTNNYVIKVESVVAMTGIHDGWYIGASTGNFQVKTKAVLSNSGKLYTITFSSTTLPNLYTNIHILYPGLIQYTNPPNVTWGSCVAITPPTVAATTTVTSIGPTTATSGGNVTSDSGNAVTARGVCWGTTSGPTIALATKTTNGTGTGIFTSNLTDLIGSTLYYVRAYATNGGGTTYGTEVSFTTTANPLPTLAATSAASAILSTTATSGGNVTNEGTSAVTAKGVCWSTSTAPTIALTTKTNDGTGAGSFTSSLTGLSASTLYYVRAYATNASGTSYGTQVSFTTTAPAAPGISLNASNVISLYSGVYTNVVAQTAAIFNPNWGQASNHPANMTQPSLSGDTALQYVNSGSYQGIDTGVDLNVSTMNKLHIEIYSTTLTSITLNAITITGGTVERSKVLPLTLNAWNSFDILMTDFIGLDFTKFRQFKFHIPVGSSTISNLVVDNILFYKQDTWVGTNSTTWTTGSNWASGAVPTATSDVVIASSANQPVIGSNVSISSLTIKSGTTLTVNSGVNLIVTGAITNLGTISNSGLINNTGTITNTSGLIKNKSTASGTGYLLSAASTDNVTQERYLTSNQRGWRLLSNPLSTTTFGTLALGSTTPFTLGASASGAYNSATNTWSSGADTDNMVSQQAYKVFVRGISTEVTAGEYSVATPSNVTVSVAGTAANAVPTPITTISGQYYLVANPYTAPVSVSSIIAASSGLSNSVSYYNPTLSVVDPKIKAGGYDAVPVSGTAGSANDVVIPPMGAIFVQATSNGTINIPKTAIYTDAILGGGYNLRTANTKAVASTALTINVNSNGVGFDKLQLQFKEAGAIGSNIDFGKLPNSILNFYSIDGSSNKAISELELKEQSIPLGITSTALQGFTFNIAENNIPSGFEVSLVDNFLNTKTVLTRGTFYNFNIDATASSQGTARFAITLKATAALSVKENVLNSKIVMWPNPAHNQIYVLNNIQEGDTTYKIYSITGQLIHGENAVAGSTTTINTNGWAPGVYLLDATNNGNKTTKQLIIQ